MPVVDWPTFYGQILDGLEAAIRRADVEWATDAEGDPRILRGQRRVRGIDYPHARILTLSKQRDEMNSTRSDELLRVDTGVTVYGLGDPHDVEQNLDQALDNMGAVENALYADRSLDGRVEYLTVTESDAFELESDDGRITIADVQVEVTKKAVISE